MHWVSRDFGWIGNEKGDRKCDVIVELPDKADDGVVIGFGLVALGSLLLGGKSVTRAILGTMTIFTGFKLALHEQFYRGANEFWRAETKALINVHCLDGDIDDYIFG